MKTPHFAIIGAGTAGLATAILLARQGNNVTIFEQVDELSPVGAGLLLQPAGLAVFEHLGVLDKALTLGAKVTGLEGQLPDKRLLVNSHYHEASANLYGLGLHRATLCHVLTQKLSEYSSQITWCMSHSVESFEERNDEIRLFSIHKNQKVDACFDGLLIANGARSQLRPKAWVKVDQSYPWGAAWSIVPECQVLDSEILHQFYDRSKIMMGILPTGAIPTEPQQRLSSVFWSLPTPQLQSFLQDEQAKQAWLKQVSERWSKVAEWLKEILYNSQTQPKWLSANYRDVVLTQFGQGRVGVIGDAAHAMSPQLGQGANMALLDAWAFSQSLQHAQKNQNIDWSLLWQHYHQLRHSSTQFYQFLSRLLTPLYQSDQWWAGGLRDLVFPWMYQIPYFRKEMAITISGLKTGPFQQLDYDQVAQLPKESRAFHLKNESLSDY
ncbi:MULTISPECIES: FAD-dependent oxidoreductase [Acinetobacter]|uniref:FAD-dependent oxidoreductase n=1 Tax=Acinetobacter TaxID=469 RepID=UPI000E5A73D5|nr:NAD(P)/FAD-dependent oxidoreductase [Acinetobacter pittii]MCH2018383.1 FAD-dependent monooxygenase [Acinetobacter pittii]MDH0692913.1 FAD-dependent monooxygenase [Acinetobacter pittii]MDY0761193.1 NAD(P)/FAD-dependent oxidoreductase [Acinetobacter pittii]RZH02951.1 FAD-dependent monooxygenase [Acinetobacter pittii]WPP65890.1 NAD(P)/FAD-dependent oxidoreductase [Acinetobacter pittii]